MTEQSKSILIKLIHEHSTPSSLNMYLELFKDLGLFECHDSLLEYATNHGWESAMGLEKTNMPDINYKELNSQLIELIQTYKNERNKHS